MRIILIALASLLCVSLSAQNKYSVDSKKAIKDYERALSLYRMRDFVEAEQAFLSCIEAEPEFIEAHMVLAEMYWDQSRLEEAVSSYNRAYAIDSSFYPRGYYNKGRLEIRIGQYAAAEQSLRSYLRLEPNNPKYASKATWKLKQALFAQEAVANPVDFKPEPLSQAVNSSDDDYWPSLSADNKTLIITRMLGSSNNLQRRQEDFFISKSEGGEWKRAENAGAPLNTPGNEGAQSISANGKLMVYTVCNRKGVIGRCDLYYSVYKKDKWTFPANLEAPVNTVYKETQPSLSADGNSLYFASDRPGGKGGLDIWVSHRSQGGKWSNPVNLGDTINTAGDEMAPFIHHDGQTLYYASDTKLGLGGYDIFIARLDTLGEWSIAENLGYPINTHRDEFGLVVTSKGDYAYYASDINQETRKDIYRFKLPEQIKPNEVSYMEGKVFDENTLNRLRARFELVDLNSGAVVGQAYSEEGTGEFLLCIPTNRDYMLNVSKPGYLFYSENFQLKGIHQIEKPFQIDVPLRPLIAGQSIVLKNIFYETDSFELLNASLLELDKVVDLLYDNPSVKVEISGHTDNVGTAQYNLDLSQKRAKSVVDYLIEKGIEASRLSFVGYGFEKPLESNDSEEGRSKNRRTELKVVGSINK